MKSLLTSVILNSVLAALMLLTQLFLGPELLSNIRIQEINIALGVFILSIIVLEPIAIYYRVSASTLSKGNRYGNYLILIWVAHIVVSTVSLFSVFSLFGANLSGDLQGTISIINVVKEIGILILIALALSSKRKTKNLSKFKLLLTDIILVFVFFVYYLTFWHLITNSNIQTVGFLDHVMKFVVLSVFFIFYFFAARLAIFVEEAELYHNNQKHILWFWLSSITSLLIAVGFQVV